MPSIYFHRVRMPKQIIPGMKQAAEALDPRSPGFFAELTPALPVCCISHMLQLPGYPGIEQANTRIAFARSLLKLTVWRNELNREQSLEEVEIYAVGLVLPRPEEGVPLLMTAGTDRISGPVYRYNIQTHSKHLQFAMRLTPFGL